MRNLASAAALPLEVLSGFRWAGISGDRTLRQFLQVTFRFFHFNSVGWFASRSRFGIFSVSTYHRPAMGVCVCVFGEKEL